MQSSTNIFSKKQKVFFKTFGCRTNVFDTQVMMSNLKDFEVTQDEKQADIVVINSCTVTNSADSTARGYINSLNKFDKPPRVVFTGCGVWTKGENLFKENRVDSLFGHSEKEKINELLKNEERFFDAGDLEHIDDTIVEEFIGKSRAFIKIQEGCDFRCSYCIIPYVRGDARSYKEEKILEQIEKLKKLAITDSLTGIYNHKEFMILANKYFDISKRNKSALSVISLDIDFFKKVNDTYGHQAGDKVLIDLVKLINKNVRKSDSFGRLGGEEFSIILQNTSSIQAVNHAEKIRKIVESSEIMYENKTIKITISLGVVTLKDEENINKLMNNADIALYKAKNSGRNKVVLYS